MSALLDFQPVLEQFRRQLGVARLLDELEGGEEVVRAGLEGPPQLDLPRYTERWNSRAEIPYRFIFPCSVV